MLSIGRDRVVRWLRRPMPHAVASLGVVLMLAMAAVPAQAPDSLGIPVSIPYFIGGGTEGAGYQPGDRQLAEWALADWARGAEGALEFVAVPEDDALLRVYFVPAASGQYGEMRTIVVDGRRGAAVYVRPDTDALGEDIGALARADTLWRDTIVYLTCLHELGHALGLAHTADYADIMYSFGYGGDIPAYFGRYREQLNARGDIARVSGLSAGDLARLRALYPIGDR